MKTRNMLHQLSACCFRCGIVIVAVVFCASAFAGSTHNALTTPVKAGPKAARTLCYVRLSNTCFAQPCDRVAPGGVLRTGTPMNIIGEMPMVRVVQK